MGKLAAEEPFKGDAGHHGGLPAGRRGAAVAGREFGRASREMQRRTTSCSGGMAGGSRQQRASGERRHWRQRPGQGRVLPLEGEWR